MSSFSIVLSSKKQQAWKSFFMLWMLRIRPGSEKWGALCWRKKINIIKVVFCFWKVTSTDNGMVTSHTLTNNPTYRGKRHVWCKDEHTRMHYNWKLLMKTVSGGTRYTKKGSKHDFLLRLTSCTPMGTGKPTTFGITWGMLFYWGWGFFVLDQSSMIRPPYQRL